MQNYSNVDNAQPELWNVLSELENMCRDESEAHAARQKKYGELRCALMSLIRRDVGDPSQKSQSVDHDICMADSETETISRHQSSDYYTGLPSRNMSSTYRRQATKLGSMLTVPSSIPSENLVDTQNTFASIASSATLGKEEVYVNGVNSKCQAFASTHLPDAASSSSTKKSIVSLPQNHNWKAIKVPVQLADVVENISDLSNIDCEAQNASPLKVTIVSPIEQPNEPSVREINQNDMMPQIQNEENIVEKDIENTRSADNHEAQVGATPHKATKIAIDDTIKSASKSPRAKKLRPSRPIGPLSLKQRPWDLQKKRRKTSLLLQKPSIVTQEKGMSVVTKSPPIETTNSQECTVATSTPKPGQAEEVSAKSADKQCSSPESPQNKRPRKTIPATIIQDSDEDEDEEEPIDTPPAVKTHKVQTAPTTPATQPRKSNIPSSSTLSAKSRANRVRFDEQTKSTRGKNKQQEQEKENEFEEANDDDKPETNSRPRRRCSTNKPDYYKKIELPDDDEYEDMIEKVLKKGDGRHRREDVVFVSETRKRRVDDVDDEHEQSQHEDEGDVMMPEA